MLDVVVEGAEGHVSAAADRDVVAVDGVVVDAAGRGNAGSAVVGPAAGFHGRRAGHANLADLAAKRGDGVVEVVELGRGIIVNVWGLYDSSSLVTFTSLTCGRVLELLILI